jgi:hypothetical protein
MRAINIVITVSCCDFLVWLRDAATAYPGIPLDNIASKIVAWVLGSCWYINLVGKMILIEWRLNTTGAFDHHDHGS